MRKLELCYEGNLNCKFLIIKEGFSRGINFYCHHPANFFKRISIGGVYPDSDKPRLPKRCKDFVI